MTSSRQHGDADEMLHAGTVDTDGPIRVDDWLNVALEDSFPCSDPISSMRAD
ncbi:hypothetical protein JQ633_10830 [Bradyrhizobium tropiciagri]|uniref:hypothetical protein n=1 Tax=Bradyrhizobium tropiciagri TaxID=312253 RepID=UPI001BA8FDB3|nr:hypothetical protein [Bradyrhizobium tropiciagri]MBR0870852.1 hypothetical protein [Bradyrhizobium tropiciagri]